MRACWLVILSMNVARADFGDPLPGLTADQQARFEAGLDEFAETETSLLQDRAIGPPPSPRPECQAFTFLPEIVPSPPANVVAGRRSISLFGIGLVDATPAETLLELAASQLRVGCADCHTPTLTTGRSAIAALDRKTYHPYSDFLLHDMGALGDGISQESATGRLMRTAPLWGVRTQTRLLHDGRATTLAGAIQAHDGQAAGARDAFFALPAAQQKKLLNFLGSL